MLNSYFVNWIVRKILIIKTLNIFYIVEVRTWTDGTAFPYVRNRDGYTKKYLKENKIIIATRNNNDVELQCGAFILKINQFVFKDIIPARLHFENLKKIKDSDSLEAIEISFLQVEATSISTSRILPPNSYRNKNAIWLEIYQPHLSSAESRLRKSNETNS